MATVGILFRFEKLILCLVLFSAVFVGNVYAANCIKKDDCTCEMDDGKGIVSLWELDGGSSGPKGSFKDIKQDGSSSFTYSWNPCTSFSQGCTDVKICQKYINDPPKPNTYFPIGKTVKSFTVNNKNDIVMTYDSISHGGVTRTGKITLHCDTAKTEPEISKVTEEGSSHTYSATLTSKCACPGVCKPRTHAKPSSNRLSIGSILLIAFFTVLVVYIIAGILINRFGRNIESVPEVFPNFTFWKDVPYLIKDGCVFTFNKIKSLKGGSDYEKI